MADRNQFFNDIKEKKRQFKKMSPQTARDLLAKINDPQIKREFEDELVDVLDQKMSEDAIALLSDFINSRKKHELPTVPTDELATDETEVRNFKLQNLIFNDEEEFAPETPRTPDAPTLRLENWIELVIRSHGFIVMETAMVTVTHDTNLQTIAPLAPEDQRFFDDELVQYCSFQMPNKTVFIFGITKKVDFEMVPQVGKTLFAALERNGIPSNLTVASADTEQGAVFAIIKLIYGKFVGRKIRVTDEYAPLTKQKILQLWPGTAAPVIDVYPSQFLKHGKMVNQTSFVITMADTDIFHRVVKRNRKSGGYELYFGAPHLRAAFCRIEFPRERKLYIGKQPIGAGSAAGICLALARQHEIFVDAVLLDNTATSIFKDNWLVLAKSTAQKVDLLRKYENHHLCLELGGRKYAFFFANERM